MLRKIAPLFAAIIAVIVGFLLTTTAVFAVVSAGWNGDNVVVGTNQYEKTTDAIPGIPAGSQVYVNKNAGSRQASVVYFAPGADINTAAEAQYVQYDFNPPSQLTNPRGQDNVDVAPKNGSQVRTNDVTGDSLGNDRTGQATSCAITGVGWIVCPMTRLVANGMDKIFDLLKSFFEVHTITLDTDNPTYRMWDIVRGLANLCFIIAFLVIIYSQITSYGINNYEIKKMIPKLIISAILVNVSYYICAVALDLSNILGNSLQQMFVDLRGQIVGPNTAANSSVTSWESVTTFILSGGALAAAGITSAGIAVAAGASVMSLTVILVPFLLGVVFSAIIAVLILAARQALIVILITVAPLAFVAMLLPSTEKWFDKWRGLLTTMLVMFPMFAVVFGGSQLAGGLIIQTADSMTMLLVGMFVQVAPLIITPLLVKLSGSLLGKIAGMANNRQKGFIDRTRNALNEQDQRRRHRRIAEGYEQMASGQRGLTGMTKRWAARREDARHTRDHDDKAYKALSEAHGDAHWKERLLQENNDGSQTVFTPNGQRRRRLNSVRNAYASTYGYQSQSEMLDAFDKRSKEEAKGGYQNNLYGQYGRGHGNTSVADAVHHAAMETYLDNEGAQSAVRDHNREISALMEANTSEGLANRVRAAGVDTRYGQGRAMAKAIQVRANDRTEGMKNIQLMIDMQNPSAAHMHQFATADIDSEVLGIKINDEVREAAIKMIAGSQNVQGIIDLGKAIDLSQDSNVFWRTAYVDALKANGSRPKFFSMGLMDQLGQGTAPGFLPDGGESGMKQALIDAFKANAYGAKNMVSADKADLEFARDVLASMPQNHADRPSVANAVREAILGIARDRETFNEMGKKKPIIEKIATDLGVNLQDLGRGLYWNDTDAPNPPAPQPPTNPSAGNNP